MLSFWHFWFSSFPPFFRRGFRSKKRSSALPKPSPALGRPRCQGRVVFAFTGAQRTPLTGEAGGSAQSSRRKGSLCRRSVAAIGGMRSGDEISAALIERLFFWVFDGKFWRGSPHRRYRQLLSLKFESFLEIVVVPNSSPQTTSARTKVGKQFHFTKEVKGFRPNGWGFRRAPGRQPVRYGRRKHQAGRRQPAPQRAARHNRLPNSGDGADSSQHNGASWPRCGGKTHEQRPRRSQLLGRCR
jgi:hypothetical protein